VIAELKRKSPSKGILRKNFDPVKIAQEFERAGAVALSVLTDKKYFGGSSAILKKVRRTTCLPILRKDFILDAYQIYEARAIGADAILLIAAILTKKELADLSALSEKLGLDLLFEVHSLSDIKKILPLKPKIVGINNRDLKTFRVDVKTTRRLIKKIPKGALIVSESGIKSAADLAQVRMCGADAVLIGEGLIGAKGILKK
jgi:indole-3-glycerol phosphate synthase